MKIYYITNSRIPTEKAHGFQIIKTCEAFGKLGINLELILPTRKNKKFDNIDIFDYYNAKKIFVIKKIPTLDPLFLLKLRPPAGTFIKLQTLLFGRSIYKFLKKENIDSNSIIYTRDSYLIPLLLKFSKKVVWEVHDLPKNKKYYASFWKRCFKIIAITKGLEEELVRLGLGREKIVVAPDGVDLEMFQPTDRPVSQIKNDLGLPQDKKIVMYTGHLYNWKGAQILAQAADKIDPSACIVFLGGNYKAIEKFKQEYGSKENILILGRVEHKEVVQYLQAADVLVLPNSAKSQISAAYTSPLKLFEYMAVEKPIVASDLPSIKEILNENNSLLIRPDNSKALAEGINKVLKDSNFADKIGRQAFNEAGRYTWDNRAKTVINFLIAY